MAVKTQFTNLYFIDPEASGGPAVIAVECATSISGIGGTRDQIDTTCLESPARQFEAGLIAPGTMTVNINADPSNESHVRLHELYEAGTKFDIALGWSDGDSVPTLDSADEFDLPTDRTFLLLEQAYVSDFPFDFTLNAVVTSALTIQLSGLSSWVVKTTS